MLAWRAARIITFADVIVVEVADQFGRLFLFESPFELPPSGLAHPGCVTLGYVQVMNDTVEIEVLVFRDLLDVIVFELFGF